MAVFNIWKKVKITIMVRVRVIDTIVDPKDVQFRQVLLY
jgi:hypothetical protein